MIDTEMAGTESKKNEKDTNSRKRMIYYGALLVIAIVCIATIITIRYVQSYREELLRDTALQQTTILASKQESFSLWLNGLKKQGERLINTDIFRVFAAEVAQSKDKLEVLFALGALDAALEKKSSSSTNTEKQLAMMQGLLQDFILYSDFIEGSVVDARAQVYLSSVNKPLPLTEEQKQIVQSVFATKAVHFSALYASENGVVVDIVFPIFSPYDVVSNGHQQKEKSTPVAALIVKKAVTAEINELLSASRAFFEKNTLFIVQSAKPYTTIHKGVVSSVSNMNVDMSRSYITQFALKNSFISKERVYASGVNIPTTSWYVVCETSYSTVEKSVFYATWSSIAIAILLTLIVVFGFVALWWYVVQREQRELAEEFKRLYLFINEQRELLTSINSSIIDMIVLTNKEGIIQYVNKGFEEKIDKNINVIGLTLREVFGFDTAERIVAHDAWIYENNMPYSFEEIVFINSKKFYFQIVRTPYALADGKSKGIVSVFRDISHLKEQEEHTRRILQQTVDVLIHTIELRDPYLAGHTRMMRACVEGMARVALCRKEVTETMIIATDLSQIGKLAVPLEVLTKTAPLTADEKKLMEQHVQSSLEIISKIDFTLPVKKVIREMNERIDGTGYPNHLKGDAICFEAKVLGVANAFCAMIKPRAYRSALSVAESIENLKQQGGYDAVVIEILETFLASEQGERFIKQYR